MASLCYIVQTGTIAKYAITLEWHQYYPNQAIQMIDFFGRKLKGLGHKLHPESLENDQVFYYEILDSDLKLGFTKPGFIEPRHLARLHFISKPQMWFEVRG